MATVSIPDDLRVGGTLVATRFNPPKASVTNAAIIAGAAIDATKVIHQFPVRHSQPGVVSAGSEVVHISNAPGEVVAISALCESPPSGGDSITLDLQRGSAIAGYVSILSVPLTINAATPPRSPVAGAVVDPPLLAGQSLRAVKTVIGTSGQSLACIIVLRENP